MRAISIATLLLLGATVYQVASNFTSGCSMWYIHGRETLTAECQTWAPDMGKVLANLDLNNCIGLDSVSNSMVWMDRYAKHQYFSCPVHVPPSPVVHA